MNLCPCKLHRPAGMTLRDAMKMCERHALVQRYGVDGAERVEAEKWQRLAELEKRRVENEALGTPDSSD